MALNIDLTKLVDKKKLIQQKAEEYIALLKWDGAREGLLLEGLRYEITDDGFEVILSDLSEDHRNYVKYIGHKNAMRRRR